MKRLETETEAYAAAREELLKKEIALKEQVRKVAELRRRLPTDTPLPGDYVFHEGPADPCPMCSMWADAYNGVVRHVAQRANFVTCVAAPIERIRA